MMFPTESQVLLYRCRYFFRCPLPCMLQYRLYSRAVVLGRLYIPKNQENDQEKIAEKATRGADRHQAAKTDSGLGSDSGFSKYSLFLQEPSLWRKILKRALAVAKNSFERPRCGERFLKAPSLWRKILLKALAVAKNPKKRLRCGENTSYTTLAVARTSSTVFVVAKISYKRGRCCEKILRLLKNSLWRTVLQNIRQKWSVLAKMY